MAGELKSHKPCSMAEKKRTSLVIQRLRILLPMQGTQVQFPVREDSICGRAAKPMSCKLLKLACPRAHVHSKRSHHNGSLCTTTREQAPLLQLEKAHTYSNKDPAQPKRKKKELSKHLGTG